MVTLILIASLVFQFIAVYFVLRLMKLTGERLAWGFLAAAITLMALRRIVSLGEMVGADLHEPPDLYVESIALAISVLMAIGIERITPIVADLRNAADRLRVSETRYRTIFENSPISIWEEDFSKVKAYFEGLRLEGVGDIEAYLTTHPDAVRQCAGLVRIVDVNQAALTLHCAESKEALLAGLANTFNDESFEAFREELICLWQGQRVICHDAVVQTMDGEPRYVTVNLAICPGYEESFSKMFVSLIDITERKRSEAALAASERQFRSLAESLPDNIIRYDRQGRAAYLNPALEKLLGTTARDRLGKSISEYYTDGSYQAYAEAVDEVLASGEDREFEFLLPGRKENPPVYVMRMVAERDELGEIAGVLAISYDITERKRAEQVRQLHTDLLASLDRINRAIQGAGDLEGMTGSVLDELLEIFACDRARLVFPCDPDAASWQVPMERFRPAWPGVISREAAMPLTREFARLHRRFMQSEHPIPFGAGSDLPIPSQARKDGDKSGLGMALQPKTGRPWCLCVIQCSHEREWSEAEQRQFEEIGRRIADGLGGLLILRDLRESEARYHRIFDTAREGILTLDEEENVTLVNAHMAEMLGYGLEEIKGRQVTDFMLAEDLADHRQKLANRQLNRAETYERRLLRRDGRLLWTLVSASPIFDGGRYRGVLSMVTDITEQKLREDELKRYRDHLEETVQERTEALRLARDAAESANKAKSAFLTNMSHELRTPLNAILGFSQLMHQNPELGAGQRETIDIISRSGEHLLKLINDVLEIAKIEAGKLQLESAPFDLREMVLGVVDMMRLRAVQKGLELELDLSPAVPPYIKGDEARLRQILVNLVSNAVKYTDRGKVTLRLGVRGNARQHLLIEVEDTGPGIGEADREKLFTPFVQLAEGASRGGTGLGLAIISQFVELMAGSVSVESSPGKGSLFHVDLPLEVADEEEISRLGGEDRGEIIGLAPGSPAYRILIAEDEGDNQILLSRLMSGLGFEVRVAGNGEACVELFSSWRPDLIWMDRRMPVMDGLEATRRIRQLPGGDSVKIIAVTASAFKEQQQDLLNAGMDGTIHKPFRFSEIYESLATQLGVEFRYRHDPPQCLEPADLPPERLSELDPELRAELHQALEILDSVRIEALISRIAESDPVLAGILDRLAGNFDYPLIMRALDGMTECDEDT